MTVSGSHNYSPQERGELNQREFDILEAVIGSFIATARPVGSRALSRSVRLGLSPASIRNTMSDLEEKGYLYQPFQSAGRVPTDKAYRLHVNNIDRYRRNAPRSAVRVLEGLGLDQDVDRVLRRAAEALSVVTQELGVGLEPVVDEGVLEGVDLIRLSSERVMLVLNIGRGLVKTIFVELDRSVDGLRLDRLAILLREKLVGLTLREIRRTGRDRLKEAVEGEADPLNVFVQSADTMFELNIGDRQLVLGETSKLATQPEFSSEGPLRSLISLTDKKLQLVELMKRRAGGEGLSISIGSENEMNELSNFTIVTDTYRMGKMRGIIGVIGPTRMSYSRVISIVEYTSRMLSQILEEKNR
ncbi:MAG TPA: heat-inducible transcriptional repressor HrcA [Candidatus Glassbacteria bacterium]|nr:heat-inducible transcriptional repressor HrcA [Candidatus Glassbacteria bacterium]